MPVPELTNHKRDFRLLVIFTALLYFLFYIFHFKSGFGYDVWCWQEWTKVLLRKGIGHVYDEGTGVNYNPGFLYILNLFGIISGSESKVDENINFLRMIVLLFDIGGVFLAAWLLKKNNSSPLIAAFLLMNAAYLYNTLLWGQVDSVHTFFAAASIFALIYKKPVAGIILMVLSLNVKLQGIIFLPIIGILLLPYLFNDKKKIIYCLSAALITQLLILLPFIFEGELRKVWEVNVNAVDFYPKVSMNAFNMWYFLIDGELTMVLDSIKFMGLSYKKWGMLCFILTSGIALLPVFLRSLNVGLQKTAFTKKDIALISLAAGIITLNFFYFNTQMHERYSHPALLFIAVYAFLCKDYFIYFLVSAAYLLNMEKVLRHLELRNYSTVLFDPKFASVLFLITLIIGYYRLFKGYNIKTEYKRLF